jgi:hypothetical protein
MTTIPASNDCPTGEQVVAYWREMSAKYPIGSAREYSFSCGADRGLAVLAYIDGLIAEVDEKVTLIAQLRGTLEFNREQAKKPR